MTLKFLLDYMTVTERIAIYQDGHVIFKGMILDMKYELCMSLDSMYVSDICVVDDVVDCNGYLYIYCK